MKDVPGWEVSFIQQLVKLTLQAGKSVYNTKHYTPSTVVVI